MQFLRVSTRKNGRLFACGAFLSCVVDECLSKCPNSTKTPLPWKIQGTRLFVEVEIWYILISNVRRRIRMIIILLQSVTMQFCRLFWHISYYKVRQSNFITKCDRLLLQSVTNGYYKVWQIYYKGRQVLQSVTVITKWDVTKMKVNIKWNQT